MEDRDDELVEQIVELTDSPQSRGNYRKAINEKGWELVRQAYREFAFLMQSPRREPILNPGAFFTTMLGDLPDQPGAPAAKPKTSVHFESVDELCAATLSNPNKDIIIHLDGQMTKPYSGQGIVWPTVFGPWMFTLSTNKNKSDNVTMPLRCTDGKTYNVPLCRGKGFSGDLSWGILTGEDNRIIKAMIIIWQEDGYKHTTGDVMKCFCKFSIRRLAKAMGYTSFGGRDLKRLAQRVSRMNGIKYHFDFAGLPGYEHYDKKSYPFDFIDAKIMDSKQSGQRKETVMIVYFSEFVSRMLLNRKAVTRSHDTVKQTNEIALLIQEYIESRVGAYEDRDGFTISLTTLIRKLCLPPAKWHKYKSQRRNVFKKALDELKKATTWDGDSFSVEIADNADKSDYLLKVNRATVIDAKELPFGESTYSVKVRSLVVCQSDNTSYMGKYERAGLTEEEALKRKTEENKGGAI